MSKLVFFGDSLIQFYPLDDYYKNAINCGYAGYTTKELQPLFKKVIALHPESLVYLAGTNDFNEDNRRMPLEIAQTIAETLSSIEKTNIYLCSLLPCDHSHIDMHTMMRGIRNNDLIMELNTLLAKLPYHYVDLFSLFYDHGVKKECYEDSLHVNHQGYDLITQRIKEAMMQD